MPADTSILMGFRPAQIESPDVQNARAAQMMHAQQQNLLAQMQLAEKAKEQQMNNALNQFYKDSYKNESGLDTNLLRQKLVGGGYGSMLPKFEEQLAKTEKAKLEQIEAKGKVDAQPFKLSKDQSDAVEAKLKNLKGLYERLDPTNPNVGKQYLDIHNSVHNDPILKPLFTQMGVKKEDSLAQIDAAIKTPGGMEKLIQQSVMGAEKFAEFIAPKTDIGKLIAERDRLPPNDPRRNTYDAAIAKATSHAPANNITLSTEKSYGSAYGTKTAESDIKLKDAAEAAPTLAESSNRITQILKSGKVFTGTGAEFKLQLAKALKVVANTENEAIANTETLISSLAGQTLAGITSSNLGTGQGFTDKDREFLQAAKAGNISFDNKTLQRLADLSYRTAVASANKWKERVDRIPKSVLEGTGTSTEPVNIPPREGAARAPSKVRRDADAILNAKPSGSKK